MAKKKNPDPALEGLPERPELPADLPAGINDPLRLPPEVKARLEAIGPAIDRAEKEIALMKKMKMDIGEAENELKLAKLRRQIMLDNFG